MQQVTKDEFWNAVMRSALDLHPRTEGKYPYTSRFIDQRSQREFGRIESTLANPATVQSAYFLAAR